MVELIESLDCNQPAFVHSDSLRDFGLNSGNCFCVGEYVGILHDRAGSVVASFVHKNSFGGDAMCSDAKNRLKNQFSNSSYSIKLTTGSSTDFKILASCGNRIAFASPNNEVFAISVQDQTKPSLLGTFQMNGAIYCGDMCGTELMLASDSGQLYRFDVGSTELSTPVEVSTITGQFSVQDNFVIFPSDNKLVLFGRDFLLRQCSLENLPDDLDSSNMLIQGVTSVGEGEIAFLAVSDEGQDIFVVFASIDLTEARVDCSRFSLNELFLCADFNRGSRAYLRWIPEFDVLLVGHSLCDSIAFFRRSDSEWKCLLLPEGQQLGSTLINGESSLSCLRGIEYFIPSDSFKVARRNELFDCRLVVVTEQMSGWIVCHCCDLPSDWITQKFPRSPLKKGKDPVPTTTAEATPESPRSTVGLKLSMPVLGKEAVAKTMEDAAPAPPLFNSNIQPTSSMSSGGEEKETTPAPPLFNAAIKLPATGPVGEAKKEATPSFGSFGTTSFGASTEKKDSGLFGTSSFGTPSKETAAAPPLFNAAIKPPATGPVGEAKKEAAPSFGSFGTASFGASTENNEGIPTPVKGTAPVTPSADVKEEGEPCKYIDDSLVKSFEAEISGWEDVGKKSVQVTRAFDASRIPKSMSDPSEREKEAIVKVREEVRRFDSTIRELYKQDPSLVTSDLLFKYQSKCSELNKQLDDSCVKRFNVPTDKSKAPTVKSPTVLASPTSSPSKVFFHPIAPSMRKEPAGGLSLITPVKATPRRVREERSLAELLAEPAKREAVTPVARKSLAALKTPNKRLSLGDVLAGKILSSHTSENQGPMMITGGHGAAWQMLRQVEEQKKQIQGLMEQVQGIEPIPE